MNLNNLTSVIFNDAVNDTQICYHLVYPKHFNLVKNLKRTPQISGQIPSKKRRRRGRPRKEDVKKLEEVRRAPEEVPNSDNSEGTNVQLACSRTRYGRVSRPPKHMSKFIDIKETRVSSTAELNNAANDKNENQNNFNADKSSVTELSKNAVNEPKKVRKNVDRFTCVVCKKVYLGKKKMLKHHLAFPDHKTPIRETHAPNQLLTPNGSMANGVNGSLFNDLMRIVGSASQSERISIFLSEISSFVSNVRTVWGKLHLEQVPHLSTSEYYLDKNVSKVLDLPEGLFHLNIGAFDDYFQQNKAMFRTYVDEPPIVDIASIADLPQIGYNLNLFPQVNYDQITDNAVEAEVLEKTDYCDLTGNY